MKKLLIASMLAVFSLSSYAGVSKIQSNGKVSGVPSYAVSCTSGSYYIIYKKNGTWYQGLTGHMGDRYNSWSVNEVANYVCS